MDALYLASLTSSSDDEDGEEAGCDDEGESTMGAERPKLAARCEELRHSDYDQERASKRLKVLPCW